MAALLDGFWFVSSPASTRATSRATPGGRKAKERRTWCNGRRPLFHPPPPRNFPTQDKCLGDFPWLPTGSQAVSVVSIRFKCHSNGGEPQAHNQLTEIPPHTRRSPKLYPLREGSGAYVNQTAAVDVLATSEHHTQYIFYQGSR